MANPELSEPVTLLIMSSNYPLSSHSNIASIPTQSDVEVFNAPALPGRRACLGLLALSLAGLSGCDSAFKPYGHDVTGAKFGKNFSLFDPEGKVHTLADFEGRIVMVFFGFTQCPDVCPTALFRAAEIKQMLGDEASALQIIFVTIDPERDTPEVLRDYANAFEADVLPLYGNDEQTREVAKNFNVFYQKVVTKHGYNLDHTSTSYVYDTHGRIRVLFQPDMPARECTSDIQQLLAEAEHSVR
jgi:protein SCO1/2